MRNIIFILFALLFVDCNHSSRLKAQRLKDTLTELKKIADFRPLSKYEAYAFMNGYYLPRLDSLRTKRKIFIHPLTGVDFKKLFNEDSAKLEKEYSTDSAHKVSGAALTSLSPPSLMLDKKFSWDGKKLIKAVVVKDYEANSGKDNSYDNIDSIKAWHRRYGYGYMCVSYPQYNPYTKRLVIREWLENDLFCGTGRESKFWFTKTSSGWRVESI